MTTSGRGTAAARGRVSGGLPAYSWVDTLAWFLSLLALARPALLREQLLRLQDLLALGGQPGLELVRRDGVHLGEHVGVVVAAELRALALVDAGLRDLEPGVVVVAGDRVGLSAELGDPPRVGHVRRVDLQDHGGV